MRVGASVLNDIYDKGRLQPSGALGERGRANNRVVCAG